ncbi:MAG: phosphatase PAP2 family protein [Nitrospirota bacterium]|nr:MAG: phosphatase PAP2 family protein [Nitrospirota bacterium]
MMLGALDRWLFYVINDGMANGMFDAVMPLYTDRSYYLLVPFLIWLFVKDRRSAMLAFMLSLLSLTISDGMVHVLKDAIGRPRPFMVLEDARVLIGKGKAFSMPSGHAASAFAVIIPIIMMFRGAIRPVFIIGAAGVAFSRVYVGVHYPLDVVAGALVGVVAGISSIYLHRYGSKWYREERYLQLLFLFLAVISLFRFYHIITGPFELSPREAHIWMQSRVAELGNLSLAPLLASLVAMGGWFFPGSVFGIRAVAAIFMLASGVMMYFMTKRITDDRTALLSAAIFQIVPMSAVAGVILFEQSLLVFFWLSSMYVLLIISEKVSKGGKTKFYWMLLGFTAGMGMLSSIYMIIFFIALVLYMKGDPALKKYFSRPYMYIGIMVGMMIYSPVIIWNAGHDWIAFRGLVGHYIANGSPYMSVTGLLRSSVVQLVMVTPILVVMIWSSVIRARHDRWGSLLFWFSVLPGGLYLLIAILGGDGTSLIIVPYVAGMVAFGTYYLQGAERYKGTRGKLVLGGIVLAFIVSVLSHYPDVLKLSALYNPGTRYEGWKRLGDEVSGVVKELDSEEKYFIISDSCLVSSSLSFYVDGNPVTYCTDVNERPGNSGLRPEVQDMVNYSGIFVMIEGDTYSEHLMALFESCERTDVDIWKRDTVIRKFSIDKCKGLIRKKDSPLFEQGL